MSTAVNFESDSKLLQMLRREADIANDLARNRERIARDLRRMNKSRRRSFWTSFRKQWPLAYSKDIVGTI